jgi:predicted RNase H-like HicB family nuclease
MSYLYIIEKADDNTYFAYVPDLPGCTTSGETAEEVRENISEAVAAWTEATRRRGEPVPPPSIEAARVEVAYAAT